MTEAAQTSECPSGPPQRFAELALSSPLLQACTAAGYEQLTPIQALALGPALAGRDLIAQAQTGSGKTVAFALACLSGLDPEKIQTQVLVLAPTRELADQIAREFRVLARWLANVKIVSLCGGIALKPQLASLKHPPHVVVGTPGRIEELLELSALNLSGLKILVLDEADRMLDMGFVDAMTRLLKHLPKQRQTLLYSATIPQSVLTLSQRFQREPELLRLPSDGAAIEQRFYRVTEAQKGDAAASLLLAHRSESTLVFCNTRRDCVALTETLSKRGFAALALHGDMEQRDRDEALVRFVQRSVSVLVATDVAARGLDIKELPLVVSADLASDPDQHLHRIGRTARAGATGLALSLCTDGDSSRLAAIAERHGIETVLRPLDVSDARRTSPPPPAFHSLIIDGGRQDKLRPGDLVGALTGAAGLSKESIGKIDVFATRSYVAIRRAEYAHALATLRVAGIKGRRFRVRGF